MIDRRKRMDTAKGGGYMDREDLRISISEISIEW